jgi:hypothetical protein
LRFAFFAAFFLPFFAFRMIFLLVDFSEFPPAAFKVAAVFNDGVVAPAKPE